MNKLSKKIAGSLFSTCILGISSISAQERPNIIVFLVDDMGFMDTSVPFIVDHKGNPIRQPLNDWYRTPNMERLAKQGIRFSIFYAQSVSPPSRTSILTGQNAARHRTTNWINAESNNRTTYGPLEWNWKGLTRNDLTYPLMLQEEGYKTIHIGKAHLGCINSDGENPLNIGFDVNIGGSAIGHPGSYHGENGYGWIKGQKARTVPNLNKYHGTNTFLSEALTIEAGREIEKAISEHKPFYLNMAHYAVHAPFETDERFIDHYNDPSKSQYARAFATLIEGMDKSLGDILDRLEQMGVAENTLIVFLGDNGGDAFLGGNEDYASCAPLKGKKGTEYEGGVRIPFIISWARPTNNNKFQKKYPIAQNAVQTQMVTIMDLYPTILSVVGLKIPKNHVLNGGDLKKLVSGKKDSKHRNDFLMHFTHEQHGCYFTTYRMGDWKLIYYFHPEKASEPSCKLFNLANDPYEKSDLAKVEVKKVKVLFDKMVQRLETEKALYPINEDKKPVLLNLPVL